MKHFRTHARAAVLAGIFLLGLASSSCSRNSFARGRMHKAGNCYANKVGNHRR